MASEAVIETNASDPTSVTAIAPMSAREADNAIEAFLDNPTSDPVETETGKTADTTETVEIDPADEAARDDAGLTVPEDAETETTEPEDTASPEFAEGRFAADDAKVKMPDGRTISIAELKEFADTRAKEFQRDYSRKTEEHSKAVEDFESQRQEFSQRTERHSKEREFFQWYAQNYVPQEPQRPTVDASIDPVAWSVYAQQKASYDEMVNAWNGVHAINEETTKAEQEKAQQEQRKALETEHARFLKTFPSLKDPVKHKAFWDGLATDAEAHYGIPGDRVKALNDTNMVRILNDAVAYRRLKANSDKVQKDVSTKPTLVRGSAGVRQSPQAQQARSFNDRVSKLRQTGSTADADAVLLSFIK